MNDDPVRYRLPPLKIEAAYVALAETVDWGLTLCRVPQQWKLSQGEGVTVAILDTGLDERHPDLAGALDAARDFTGSRFGPRDRHGHGTHVAGTIAARKNERGVIGVAPLCRLLAAKVLGDDGSGDDAHVAAGVDWACEQGADVLSLSLGSPQPSRRLAAALQAAVAAGKFVICAAGNDAAGGVNYPARWPFTVAVGAVDREGTIARFSSRGPEVDICAPGQDVLSTWLRGGYAKLSGTSMAAPFVSGVAALALAKHRTSGGQTPLGNQSQLLEHLARTAIDDGPRGRDPGYGWGLIDPAGMLAA